MNLQPIRDYHSQTSESYFHAILQSMPHAVIVSGTDGRIVLLNTAAEKMFGYKCEQLINQSIETLVPQRFQKRHVEHRRNFLANPRVRMMGEQLDLFAARADGSEFPVAVSLGYFNSEVGTLAIATVQDLTELQERDRSIADLNRRLSKEIAELAALNYELEAFSYSVSHDLRGPLRAIDGFSQMLQHDHTEHLDETGRDYLARIRRAAQRMGSLIDDLLTLSRISRVELTRADVDLSALAREILSETQAAAPDRDVEFDIADGIRAYGDAGLLRIALQNLLSNALKFTAGRSSTRIGFGQQALDGKIAYYVRDNGIGFNMTYAGKLFGAFQRLHDDCAFPGDGIGLATVQRIINKHGGRIWAEAAPEKGATFYFTL